MFKSETWSRVVSGTLSWMLSMALIAPQVGETIQNCMSPSAKSRKNIINNDSDPVYPDTKAGGYNGHDCGTIQPGSVISTSYGGDEASLSSAYLIRQCNE
jgi:hypothetical protein